MMFTRCNICGGKYPKDLACRRCINVEDSLNKEDQIQALKSAVNGLNQLAFGITVAGLNESAKNEFKNLLSNIFSRLEAVGEQLEKERNDVQV